MEVRRERTAIIITIVIISCNPHHDLGGYLLCYPDFSETELKPHSKLVEEPGSNPICVLGFSAYSRSYSPKTRLHASFPRRLREVAN